MTCCTGLAEWQHDNMKALPSELIWTTFCFGAVKVTAVLKCWIKSISAEHVSTELQKHQGFTETWAWQATRQCWTGLHPHRLLQGCLQPGWTFESYTCCVELHYHFVDLASFWLTNPLPHQGIENQILLEELNAVNMNLHGKGNFLQICVCFTF